MSQLTIRFRGLFTLVRHIDPPPGGRTASSAEQMSIVFARDDVPEAGHTGHVLSRVHEAKVLMPAAALPSEDTFQRLGINLRSLSQLDDYTEFPVNGLRLWLPASGADERQPVNHAADQDFPADEDHLDPAAVGEGDHWKSLSRLPCLNTITGSEFDVDVRAVPQGDQRVQGIVELSGGFIQCVRSYKSLGDAYVEFFTRKENSDHPKTCTRAIQPFSEDVDYLVEADAGGGVEIGLGRLHDQKPLARVRVAADPEHPLVIGSLPPANVTGNSLNHFSHYYPLMKNLPDDRRAFVRMLAWWDGQRFRHTMPPLAWTPPTRSSRSPLRILTTGGACNCLASQAFRP